MHAAVKVFPLVIAILIAALLGLHFVPALETYTAALTMAALGGSVLLAGLLAAGLKRGGPTRPAVRPVEVPGPESSGLIGGSAGKQGTREGVEAIGLLSALQEQGRLIDFLMDDIAGYEDAQVGAAARIVHSGCRGVLDQNFSVIPACESAEGTTISVPASHRGDEYRLSGSLNGQAPFSGSVVHRGWKASAVNLPRIVPPEGGVLPNIAPTEVEVR